MGYFQSVNGNGEYDKVLLALKEVGGEKLVANDLLEKKWTSVVRLQRKVMELDAKVEELSKNSILTMRDAASCRGFPKSSPEFKLEGHRCAITVLTYFWF